MKSSDQTCAFELRLLADGMDATAHRMRVPDVVDALQATSNIARRAAIFSTTSRTQIGPNDSRNCEVHVSAPRDGSIFFDFSVMVGQALLVDLTADGVKATIKNAFELATGRFRGPIEPEDPQNDLSEVLHASFVQMANVIGRSAGRVTVSVRGANEQWERVFLIDSDAKRSLTADNVGDGLVTISGVVSALNDETGKGIFEISSLPENIQTASRRVRFWTSQTSEARDLLGQDAQKVIPGLSTNLMLNNQGTFNGQKTIDVKARPILASNGRLKRLIIESLL